MSHVEGQLATEHEDLKGIDILRLEVLLTQIHIISEEPCVGLDADKTDNSMSSYHEHYVTVDLSWIVKQSLLH